MAYRASTGELVGGDRWDRNRFTFESARYGDERDRDVRFEQGDRYYTNHGRESSVDDRYERRQYTRPYDDDYVTRDRTERRYYDEEARYRRPSPPPEFERRVLIEKERERDYRSPSPPPRRPGQLLRRQSSLDTFDRRPAPRFVEREEYGPPARREDYRPERYQPIPLPRSRALPPPRIYAERDYDEIRISEPERYGDDEYRAYPERVREREIRRTRRRRDRSASRTNRSHTHHSSSVRSSSRSSTTTSHSSSSSGGTTVKSAKSEYPKKGKTRIPARLVSKRALIELGYPYEEESNTIIVQKALGQENIDDLLKMSEEYKKAELEIAAARSSAGEIVQERRTEVFALPPPPVPAPLPLPPLAPAPPPPEVVVEKTTVVRDVSPVRSHRSYSTSTTSRTPYIVEARPREVREVSEEVAVGPLALVAPRREDDIALEIERLKLEQKLIRRERHHSHHRHHSHSHSHSPHRELVRAERLGTGELVLYEEKVEKIEEPRRGVRIEKDKKGRMSISVPKNR